MKRCFLLTALAATVFATFVPGVQAGGPRRAARIANYHASARPWHGDYAYTPVGEPVALIVPPHADTMASWGWGVSQSEIRPLYHQFGRANPGGAFLGSQSPWMTTPIYPSHTDQFGVYPVRGPWR